MVLLISALMALWRYAVTPAAGAIELPGIDFCYWDCCQTEFSLQLNHYY
jgi:hypothetical protein